jgi:SRSO17 transposase
MVGMTSDWKDELGRWLKPFLDRLGHKARRQMYALYVAGLIGPGDRKSVQPMAERLGRIRSTAPFCFCGRLGRGASGERTPYSSGQDRRRQ